mgnify:FL=1
MTIFTHVKHTNTVFRNARMLSSSITSKSGGWGRSNITANHNVMHNYSMYVNFGVPKDYSGHISILFNYTKPSVETNAELTPIKTPHPKSDEFKIINDAPISYYTYS